MRNYHRDKGSHRCALKVYLLKAYGTLNWEFLVATLQATGFPQRVIHWIKECITTARFSVNINGELCGFFSNSRGLRQGEQAYLFAFAMHLGLMEDTNNNSKFHWKFQKERISHLCFADDLLILCRGEEVVIALIKNCLLKFKDSSLRSLLTLQRVISCGVSEESKRRMLVTLGYNEGRLPVRY